MSVDYPPRYYFRPRLRTVLCLIFGHRWMRVGFFPNKTWGTYSFDCRRCGVAVEY